MRNILLAFCLLLSWPSFATEYKEGSLIMKDVLRASKEISNATSSKFVVTNIPGKIIAINGTKYEIRFFSFEDTRGILPANISFKQYIAKNKLLKMKSSFSQPHPNIHLESFYFLSTELNDGVYFGFVLRKLEK